MQKNFKLGDEVWFARANDREKYITCPYCFGKKYLTVIFGDDSRVTTDCPQCQCGYNPSSGVIKTYEFEAFVELIIITGVESRIEYGTTKNKYYFNNCNYVEDLNIFATKEEALIRANELKQEHEKQEQEALSIKYKNHRSWAWNASYHKGCIKRAKEDIEFHTKKLNVAQQHIKGEKTS